MNILTSFLDKYYLSSKRFSRVCIGSLATALILNLSSASKAYAQISLFNQFVGDYGYVVTGGTLRTQSNSNDACEVKNTDTETLSGIPPTATVVAAYLYWAGSQGPAPDYDVTFEGQSLSADRTFTDSFSLPGFPTFNWFQGFEDITAIVAAKGNGSYTFSDLTVDTGTTNSSMCAIEGVLSGWSLLVVYEDSTTVTQTNAINIYDGFSISRNTSQDFTLSGIQVSANPISTFTSLLWEGDLSLGGSNEFFSFEGSILSDFANAADNPFNSSINSLDLGADTVYGVDLDTFDVSSFTSAGATSVTGRVSSNNDLVILAASVVGVSIASADLEVTKIVDNATPSVGESITYSITVTNQGDDNAGGVTLSDVLPSEVSYLSSSGPGSYNPNSGEWAVGSLNVGASATLQITVQVDAAGTFSNTANVQASDLIDPDSTPGNNDPLEDDQDSVSVTATMAPTYDNGDAPASYGDARHIVTASSSVYLGNTAIPDTEADSLNSANGGTDGVGDDNTELDDEDGVALPASIEAGTTISLPVIITGNEALNAWVDWDGNGTFDLEEQIATDAVDGGASDIDGSTDGTITISVTAPSGATVGSTYARFRYSSDNSLGPTGNASDGEVEDYRIAIATASNPNIVLAKRITAINRGLSEREQLFDNSYIDVAGDPNDNETNWPGGTAPATIGSGTVESYIRGITGVDDLTAIADTTVRPGDEIEYTIPFLSNGGTVANDVLICDRIPENTTFVNDAFNNLTPASPGSGNRGIYLEFNNQQVALTNINDGDEILDTAGSDDGVGGYYFASGISPSSVFSDIDCGGSTNDNGVIVVDLSDIPNATGEGIPSSSYGFVRFSVVVD